MMRDNDFGIVRARAFGTYDFKITDPKLFLKEVAGSDQNFRLDEFADTMRSRIVSVFTDALASAKIPVLDVASRYGELGEALLPLINPVVAAKYGLQITSFIVENVSVPPEVEQAIDKRSSMAAVGQPERLREVPDGAGDGKGAAARRDGHGAGGRSLDRPADHAADAADRRAAACGAGAQAAAPRRAAAAELLSPADVAKTLGVPRRT